MALYLLFQLAFPALALSLISPESSPLFSHQKRDGCIDIDLKGIPVVSNSTDDVGFLGYVSPAGSRLSAVAIHNQTTDEAFYLFPGCSGKTFRIVSPDGLVFKLNKDLVVTEPPLQACSLPSLLQRRQDPNMVGGGFVSLDIVQCGQPATGLIPSRLQFTCDLPFFHYLGFSWDNMPLYKNDAMFESAPGRYSGWCPFPAYTDLSQQPLCTKGREAIKPICEILAPKEPTNPTAGLVVDLACGSLLFLEPEGLALWQACKKALGAAVKFCKVATNEHVDEALCGEPPAEIDIDILVRDRDTNEQIKTHMSILPTGAPRPLQLPTLTLPGNCPSATPGPTSPQPPAPSGTETPQQPDICAAKTRNGGFEGGFPENPANGFQGYNFRGCCPTWGIDCYQGLGFAATDGRCYAYTYPIRSEPHGTPGASNTNNGIFQNLDLDNSCVGRTYTFSVNVRRQPNIDADCGVQVLLSWDGPHNIEETDIYYDISTTSWQTITYAFESLSIASGTAVQLNFFCTRIGTNGPPYFAFDSWTVS
ncbi:hypothetical protein OQA88_932 [Cercophora sp. LCS_1]